MPRPGKNKKSILRRATSAVKRLFMRGRFLDDSAPADVLEPPRPRVAKPQPKAAKYAKRGTDIPLDVLDRVYTPPATSSKASFRSDGSDHQLDQEFALGRAESDWNDEDRYTNKSGDPRIGTHRRTYEPDETSVEERE